MTALAVTTTQVTVSLLAVAALAAGGWWTMVRARSRPERALAAARRLLDRGDWSSALDAARRLEPRVDAGRASWHESRRLFEGDCLVAACDDALRQNQFDDAAARLREAAHLLGFTPEDATHRVVEAMLAEARRISVSSLGAENLPALLSRIEQSEPGCAEAAFLRGFHDLRRGNFQAASATFTSVHAATRGRPIDAALYLGALLLRDGKPREALRVLGEVNKSAPQCPIVSWQLGAALSATGGDALLTVRALQKAAGPEGFPRYLADPNRMWSETLPADSWIRNLARGAAGRKVIFLCPLGFSDVKATLTAARRTLAEALVAAHRPDEALPILNELQRADDSPALHRSLGAALAMLERYDDALPHLQKAVTLQVPPEPRSAGLLAHCLAKARGDRSANLRAALDWIVRYPGRGDAEWSRCAGAVLAAAQSAGIPIAPEQIAGLAGDLAAAEAHDPSAAAIFDMLAQRDPSIVPFEGACLYVRAALQHGVRSARDLELFQRAFGDRAKLQWFFETRGWDFAAAERLFLERWSDRFPGSFPEALGTGYAATSEASLLAQSRRLEAEHQLDAAQSAAALAHKLAPTSAAIFDRLAELAYRRERREEAIGWLTRWRTQSPDDPRPWMRLALLHHSGGHIEEADRAAKEALQRSHGRARSAAAFVGARVSLAAGRSDRALALLNECLTFEPANPSALIARAALLWQTGDHAELARTAEALSALVAEDPWTHFFTAVGAFAAGRDDLAMARAEHAARPGSEAAAAAFHLKALVHLRQDRLAKARSALQNAVRLPDDSTVDHARALLGQVAWNSGEFADALKSWQSIPPALLKSWQLDDVIPGGAFLAGLQALRAGRQDDAAKWLRAAARLRFHDSRLGPWLAQACDRELANGDEAILRLQQAIEAAGALPSLAERLAREYRRRGQWADAHRVLDNAEESSSGMLVERGLLALAERQLAVAERAFSEAMALDGDSRSAVPNLLFTRLSLGRIGAAAELLPHAMAMAPTHTLKRLCQCLQALVTGDATTMDEWTSSDDELVIGMLQGIGRWDTVDALFESLTKLRASSPLVRKMHVEMAALRAKDMIDRGDAAGALRRYGAAAQSASPVIRNLLGVAAALRQDFASACRHFIAALPPTGDARIEQNLALVCEWQGDAAAAAEHWRRFLAGHAAQMSRPRDVPHYHRRIETLARSRLNPSTAALSPTH